MMLCETDGERKAVRKGGCKQNLENLKLMESCDTIIAFSILGYQSRNLLLVHENHVSIHDLYHHLDKRVALVLFRAIDVRI